MSEKVLDKDMEQIVELLMLTASKTKEDLRCITFLAGDQFPFRRKKAVSKGQNIRYKKFPGVIRMNQYMKSR